MRLARASWFTRRLPALLLATGGCSVLGDPNGKSNIPAATMVWSNNLIGSAAQTAIDDANVYVLHNAHDVFAFEKSTGQLRWKTILPYSPAATLPGFGMVLVANVLVVGDQHAFGLDPATGAVLWHLDPGPSEINMGHSYLSASGTTVFFGSKSAYLYAVDGRTGTLLWRTRVVADTTALVDAPVPKDSVVYVSFSDGRLPSGGGAAAVRIGDGIVLWVQHVPNSSPLNNAVPCAAAVTSDRVIVGAGSGIVYSLNRTTGAVVDSLPRTILRETTRDSVFAEWMVLAMDGAAVFVGTGNGEVASLDPSTLRPRWVNHAATTDPPFSALVSAMTSGGGTLYVAGGGVAAVRESDGKVLWRFSHADSFIVPPSVDATDVYVAGVKGVYRVKR